MSHERESVSQPEEGPPWIQPEIQQHVKWRDGDIVISVPPKAGRWFATGK